MLKFWDLVANRYKCSCNFYHACQNACFGIPKLLCEKPKYPKLPSRGPMKVLQGTVPSGSSTEAISAREQTREQFSLFVPSRRVHSPITWDPVTATDVLTYRRITQLSPARFLFYKITSSDEIVVLSRFGMLVATPLYVHFPLCSMWASHIGAQFSHIYLSVVSSSRDKAKNFC